MRDSELSQQGQSTSEEVTWGGMSKKTGHSGMPSAAYTSHPRMPMSERAKIFVPFNPLKGFSEALREQERIADERGKE